MKKMNKLFPIALGLLVSFFLILSSCNKMDDIQRKYAERAEQVYLGKVDSIVSYPGFNRAKLTWYISADPRIDRTIIYWNLRKDSLVKEFAPTSSGIHKDSILMENLPEGSTLYEFRNVNSEGQTSLYTSTSVTVWGSKFTEGLHARKLTAFDFDYSRSVYALALSPAVMGDSVVYSQIIYKNSLGEDETIRIERDTITVELADFPDGGAFRFRTVFFPPQGIDTVYDDYAIFKAPRATTERGMKISLAGDMSNKYFERNQKELYEWNADGDVIVYTLGTDGSLTESGKFPSVVPRTAYRDFFFYDDDKFIGISKANGVTMLQIVDGQLAIVKATPASADAFGSGFNFPSFFPAKGYFFSMTAGTGEMKIWLAQNNATWGTPNGKTAGKGFEIYDPFILFNNQALLGVDAEGYLWSHPVSISGAIGSKSRIGSGWDRFKKIVSVGTTLYGMEENGDFYVFNNFNTTDNYWIVN